MVSETQPKPWFRNHRNCSETRYETAMKPLRNHRGPKSETAKPCLYCTVAFRWALLVSGNQGRQTVKPKTDDEVIEGSACRQQRASRGRTHAPSFPMSQRSTDGSDRKACHRRGPARAGYWGGRAYCGSRRTASEVRPSGTVGSHPDAAGHGRRRSLAIEQAQLWWRPWS